MPEHFAPETDQQIRDFVAWAAAEKQRLSIQGTGTKTEFGYPVDADSLLSLHGHRGITAYEPAELVMSAKAGTPLDEIEQELAGHGQCLAFDPPRPGKLYPGNASAGTIGGVFMGNLSGPRRYVAGAARDHILGVRAVNGRGEEYKSGGSVIKNVTGYDLSKLLTGSWGTLSVVTDFTFKVLPLPPVSSTLVISDITVQEAFGLIGDIAQGNWESSGLALIPARIKPVFRRQTELDGNLITLRLEGTAASVRERADAIAGHLSSTSHHRLVEGETSDCIWGSIRDAEVFSDPAHTPALMKLSIPPSAAPDISGLIEQLGGCEWYADAAAGWIWVGICQASSEDKINTIRREAASCSGSAVLYRAPEAVKRNVGVFSEKSPALTALNRRIKHSFDPENIFNPGRLGDI